MAAPPLDPAPQRAPGGRIPVAGPWITEKEVAAVGDAAANAWYGRAGEWHERFESAFAAHLGVKHAMALPSCTSAIHLALLALGVGPGDEVVVPEITWIASAAPISYVGATPVFADVDARTWCLTAESAERCLTPRTKAILAVDLYGGMPDMDALSELAGRRGVALVEDAAEAVGARWRGRPAGSFGEAGVFSFHGSKTLTTGEGGLLATNRDDLFARAQVLRDHGRRAGDTQFFNAEIGWKYKMSALQAALGWAQLERLPELVARKREIFGWYREELGGCAGLALNHEPPGSLNVYWMVTAVLDGSLGLRKEALAAALAQRGIDTRPFFHPLSALPAYAGTEAARAGARRNAQAYALSPWGINLPSALTLTREEVARVGEAVRALLEQAARERPSRAAAR